MPVRFIPGSAVKVSFQALFKSVNVEKQVISTVMSNILQLVGDTVKIELRIQGKLESKQSYVIFKSTNKPKTLIILTKLTVKNQ